MSASTKQLSNFFKTTGKYLELTDRQIEGLEGIYKMCFGVGNEMPRPLEIKTIGDYMPRFEKLHDGWVKDHRLGLDWGPSSENEMNWDKANKYCDDKDGRLPTREELQSIVDYERRDPCVDTSVFRDTKSSWYWTSSPVAGYDSGAWCVSLGYGVVDGGNKGYRYYVRPVRASQ